MSLYLGTGFRSAFELWIDHRGQASKVPALIEVVKRKHFELARVTHQRSTII